MLFAKKAKSDNIEGGLYQSEVFSYTYKKKVTLIVSHEWLHTDDHVQFRPVRWTGSYPRPEK